MAPTLFALLSFGTLARPSLRAEPGLVIPWGKPVTLWCEGSPGADQYFLKKEGAHKYMDECAAGRGAQFLISSMAANTAGRYQCLYSIGLSWSEASDALELVVTSRYEPPSLSALPSPEVASGHNVTLQCQSQQWMDRSALYKDGEEITQGLAQPHERGSVANFHILVVSSTHRGTYRCYTFDSRMPQEWSAPSEPLVLRVTGEGAPAHPRWENVSPWGAGAAAGFLSPISGPGPHLVLQESAGPKGCLSRGLPKDPDGADLLTLPLSSAPASSGLTAGVLTGVSASLILFFLSLLLLLCHRCRRLRHQTRLGKGGRETEIKKNSSSSDPAGTPLEETLYAAVKEDRQTEGARQEDTAAPKREDPQEVTYAQLNLTSLRAGAEEPPCSGPVEPSLYAALSRLLIRMINGMAISLRPKTKMAVGSKFISLLTVRGPS
ncbi:platelet glycoprotein VI-like [Dromiciops gliroides]|uniref:platelet glycoprotein VI-like n=1 Tax=Dromiciops gliroides TaxID=33562 RepID=UPI001CC4A9A8|nr:platelet glycoprotein VI-like [Dromiciops gliroides]